MLRTEVIPGQRKKMSPPSNPTYYITWAYAPTHQPRGAQEKRLWELIVQDRHDLSNLRIAERKQKQEEPPTKAVVKVKPHKPGEQKQENSQAGIKNDQEKILEEKVRQGIVEIDAIRNIADRSEPYVAIRVALSERINSPALVQPKKIDSFSKGTKEKFVEKLNQEVIEFSRAAYNAHNKKNRGKSAAEDETQAYVCFFEKQKNAEGKEENLLLAAYCCSSNGFTYEDPNHGIRNKGYLLFTNKVNFPNGIFLAACSHALVLWDGENSPVYEKYKEYKLPVLSAKRGNQNQAVSEIATFNPVQRSFVVSSPAPFGAQEEGYARSARLASMSFMSPHGGAPLPRLVAALPAASSSSSQSQSSSASSSSSASASSSSSSSRRPSR